MSLGNYVPSEEFSTRCPAKIWKWRGTKPNTALTALDWEVEENSGSHPDNWRLPEKAEQAGPKICILDYVDIWGRMPVEICTVVTTQVRWHMCS